MKQRFAAGVENCPGEDGAENILKICIAAGSQGEFSLALAMLRHEIVEAIVVHDKNDEHIQPIEIRVDPLHDREIPTVAYQKRVTLSLTMRDLDYWLDFFLRYCRDGVAEVDHLDLEAESTSDTEAGVFVVLAVEQSLPPVPGDEARRLLGL